MPTDDFSRLDRAQRATHELAVCAYLILAGCPLDSESPLRGMTLRQQLQVAADEAHDELLGTVWDVDEVPKGGA